MDQVQSPTFEFPKKILLVVSVALAVWWAILFFKFNSSLTIENLRWGAVYQIVAFIGAVSGIIISNSWGGAKSLIGRAVLVFSIGLLLQNFGQTVFSIYNLVLKVQVPYPSLADVGFFGSIPFYIYGTYLIGRVCGSRISLKSYHGKAFAFLLPAVLLGLSYTLFLRGYQFDFTNPLKIVLDFGYPLGQATYISLAMLAFVFSKDFLGGVMKSTVLLLLGALCVQYIADFNFLYQAGNNTWLNGGYGDMLYLLAYTFLSFALIQFGAVFSKIRNTQ
ncbi:MAG: hypothetical protein WCG55_01235 [bacterium]